MAIALATVAVNGVTVVALFTDIHDPVATLRDLAISLATIAIDRIAVVAFLTGIDDAITRLRFASYDEAYDELERFYGDLCCSDDRVEYLIQAIQPPEQEP